MQDNVTFSDTLFHSREMTVLASRNALPDDFNWVLENVASARLKTTSWVTHHTTPEALSDVFSSWLLPQTRVIKAMLTFENV